MVEAPELLEASATIAAVALSLSPLPTMHTIWVSKDTLGFPVEPLLALTAGCVVNLLYGFVTKLEVLIICNALQLHLFGQLYIYHRAASARAQRSVKLFVAVLTVSCFTE